MGATGVDRSADMGEQFRAINSGDDRVLLQRVADARRRRTALNERHESNHGSPKLRAFSKFVIDHCRSLSGILACCQGRFLGRVYVCQMGVWHRWNFGPLGASARSGRWVVLNFGAVGRLILIIGTLAHIWHT